MKFSNHDPKELADLAVEPQDLSAGHSRQDLPLDGMGGPDPEPLPDGMGGPDPEPPDGMGGPDPEPLPDGMGGPDPEPLPDGMGGPDPGPRLGGAR
jgi:hypothetical protein